MFNTQPMTHQMKPWSSQYPKAQSTNSEDKFMDDKQFERVSLKLKIYPVYAASNEMVILTLLPQC